MNNPQMFHSRRPCHAKATKTYGTKRYCITHFPPVVKAREIAVRTRKREKYQAEMASLVRTGDTLDLFPALVNALRPFAKFMERWE